MHDVCIQCAKITEMKAKLQTISFNTWDENIPVFIHAKYFVCLKH